MKRLLLLFLTVICTLNVSAQSKEAKKLLENIEGQWDVDDNNNVSVSQIIEEPSLKKEEIFNRALSYITYNYNTGDAVIQINDKDAGLIVGKGLYPNVHIGNSFTTINFSTWHILRIDVKDGRARIIVTLTEYRQSSTATGVSNSIPSVSRSFIGNEYPINEKGSSKTMMTKAFVKSYERALNTLNGLEKAIKEGSTSKTIENTDW